MKIPKNLVHVSLLAAGLSLVTACVSVQPGRPVDFQPLAAGMLPLPAWALEGPIYEISLRPFTQEGTFSAATKKLEEVRDLGVKTIWLEPFSPLGELNTTIQSLYCQKDKRGVDPRFGTLEDFHNFRDRAHELGMKVILDVSLFQTSWDHPWMKEHPDWYERTETGEIHVFRGMYADIPGLRQDHPEVRQAMLDILVYWIRDQGVDGFRLDSAAGIQEDFWIWALPQVYAIRPLLLLAELGLETPVPEGPNMFYEFANTLEPFWNSSNAQEVLELTAYSLKNSRGIAPMKILSSYDEDGEKSPTLMYDGPEGARGAAVLTFTLPGIPRIFAGLEVGSLSEGPVKWSWKTDWTPRDGSLEFHKKFIALWNCSSALQQGSLVPWTDPRFPQVAAFERRSGQESVKVAVNMTDKPVEYYLPQAWLTPGLQDLWQDKPWSGGMRVSLSPYGWILLGTETVD